MKNEERENIIEHRNELRDLSNVMVEETEKNHVEIINDIQLQHSQANMSFEELHQAISYLPALFLLIGGWLHYHFPPKFINRNYGNFVIQI